eukprot:Clim_evm53s22 gene=Clim_evmTU53s22
MNTKNIVFGWFGSSTKKTDLPQQVILVTDEEGDEYGPVLKEASVGEVTHLPSLKTNYDVAKDIEETMRADNASNYDGVVFTDKRAADAIIRKGIEMPESWKKLPMFVIGRTTAASASKLWGSEPKLVEKNATDMTYELGKYWPDVLDNSKRVLMIAGNLDTSRNLWQMMAKCKADVKIVQWRVFDVYTLQENVEKYWEIVRAGDAQLTTVFYESMSANALLTGHQWAEEFNKGNLCGFICIGGAATTGCRSNNLEPDVITDSAITPDDLGARIRTMQREVKIGRR